MKLLTIGIDGGTKSILDHMPMPFVHGLFEKARAKELNEDILSRGWAEIISGEHASKTNAYYFMPLMDKTYRFTRKYNLKDLLKNENINPIWKKLNDRGFTVGIMNVPTTSPAPKVKGFLVSGGGGGLSASDSISPTMVYPPESVSILNECGYIFDVRLPRHGKNTFADFASKIKQAQEVQKNAFLRLCDNHKPDFGFFCFRITTELQYLAMSEIEAYVREVQNARKEQRPPKPLNKVQEHLVEHFKHMDKCIEEMFNALSPQHFIFCGDHSTTPFRKEINIDILLEKNGFLTRMNFFQRRMDRGIDIAKRLVEKSKKKLGLLTSNPAKEKPITKFVRSKTTAFGTFYETGNFGGVYINDFKRFGGPVKSDEEAQQVALEICNVINSSAEAKKFGLNASLFKKGFDRLPYQAALPDIRIYKPDDLYCTCRKDEFSVENSNYRSVSEDIAGVKYPYTGLKGHDPIFVADNNLFEKLTENDPDDNRSVYLLIDRAFSKSLTE